MNQIWQTLTHTPWWVYLLFVYLILLGIKASKTRMVSLRKLFVIPLFFTFISIHTLFTSFSINAFSLSVLVGSILVGTLAGWAQIIRYQLKIDKQHGVIQIPGSWVTLALILVIFASKYYFGYELATDPQLVKQTGFEFSMLGISGLTTGLFVGRLACYVYRYITSAHTPIKKDSTLN